MAMPLAATVAHDKQTSSLSSTRPDATSAERVQENGHVTIEEYMYWASISRHEESKLPKVKGPIARLLGPGKSNSAERQNLDTDSNAPNVALEDIKTAPPPASTVSDGEWQQAHRAARTAGWAAVFYLITTDVLGPYTVPWAMAQMGYGPGISLYTVFGALAGYTGWQVCCLEKNCL